MRESLRSLKPYRPPEAKGLALHRNTNRLGTNPAAGQMARLFAGIDLSDYPNSRAQTLRRALAVRYGLQPENFLVANGSNEVFDLIFKTFLNPGDPVVFPNPSYAMYRHYALINAARPIEVPLDAAFDLKADAILGVDAELIVLCTPNNPTGNTLSPNSIEAVLRSGHPVVIDEAYGEFAGANWIERACEFPNLLVTRTFSKAYGLAGLRVGYLAACPELIEQIERARLPYNLNALSQALATAALNEQPFVRDYLALIRRERPRWAQALSRRGFRVWPSQANFLLAAVPQGFDRDTLVRELADRRVLVRSAGSHPRLQRCVRITVGTPDDLEVLLTALDEVLPCR